MLQDFITLSNSMEIFIVENDEEKIGFVTIKRIDKETAEIPLIYFNMNKLGKEYGIGNFSVTDEYISIEKYTGSMSYYINRWSRLCLRFKY